MPVTIDQKLPLWQPERLDALRSFNGAVRVSIDATGRVTAAEIQKSVNPSYDRMLLEASKAWRYRPATFNGEPVPSEKIVEIVLRPVRQ